MTLDEAIQEFEFDCKIRHLSPKTIDNYKSSYGRKGQDDGVHADWWNRDEGIEM